MQEESFEVQYTQEGERLDKVLSEIYPDFSRSFFQKLIKNKQIQVNGAVQKASYPVHTEDLIRVTIPDAVETTIEPENIPLDILYEDDDVLIVNKPKGMVVHPSAGHYSGTLVNAIMYHCKDSLSGINGQIRPGIVHRIDMDTTGSLIVCKNDESHVNIAEQIKEHTVNRIYVVIVCGNVTEDEGTIEGAIGRHPVDRKKMAVNEKNGKPAITHYKVLERFGNYTYMQFQLETGRTRGVCARNGSYPPDPCTHGKHRASVTRRYSVFQWQITVQTFAGADAPRKNNRIRSSKKWRIYGIFCSFAGIF